nr:hypothetical protein [Tanacetum cinerariifolium]
MNPSSETEYDAEENVWSGRNVLSLFTGFGDVHLGSSFTTVVPDDIGASSKPARLDEPIVQTDSINANPNSYAGVTCSKQASATKGEASKFMFTKVDNVFEGVDISM